MYYAGDFYSLAEDVHVKLRTPWTAIFVATACLSSIGVRGAELEEVNVIGVKLASETTRVSPASTIDLRDLQAINLITAEDAVAYEPSIVIRRRYVGDPNGVVGIRGAGMFQTARSLVYADGLPLHYLLQTRWSGSPRWSLVAPNEIRRAQVIYGPFSAQYSGNAMGGVVELETRTPTTRRFVLQGSLMSQDYDALGTNEVFDGSKLFASYEDRFDSFSLYASYNRLENDSQPMTNFALDASESTELDARGVTGYLPGRDDRGEAVIYIGDSGPERSVSELYKLKLGYEFSRVQLRGTVAYEQRSRDQDNSNNYLRDAQGEVFWEVGGRNYEDRHHRRDSLLLGLGASFELSANWYSDIYATHFDIRKDEETRTGLSPNDPEFGARSGRYTEYDDTGWSTFDLKFGTDNLFGNGEQRLALGLYADAYSMELYPFDVDAKTGEVLRARSASGGDTETQAAFIQWGAALGPNWDLSLGLRYERWRADDGFSGEVEVRDRSESATSPKFSLAYSPNSTWQLRYSVARAVRFPITEELYRNERSTTNIVVADASLNPEEGLHHNFSIERELQNGQLQLNLFFEEVDDTIYNQTGVIRDGDTNVRVATFLAIDEVQTQGVEFIFNREFLFGTPTSLRFNASYTDAEIIENKANPDIEGNEMPRIPQWRANLILNYPASRNVDLSASLRYASDSYGDLDNGDTQSEVYGAIDDYLFVNLKAHWDVSEYLSVSAGVDNVFDDMAYVAHPWPSRTVYLEAQVQF